MTVGLYFAEVFYLRKKKYDLQNLVELVVRVNYNSNVK